MMHEWEPHKLETLVVCRQCKCVRYDAVKIDENYKRYDIKYLYCNNGDYQILKNGKIQAAWVQTHPHCARFENAREYRIPGRNAILAEAPRPPRRATAINQFIIDEAEEPEF